MRLVSFIGERSRRTWKVGRGLDKKRRVVSSSKQTWTCPKQLLKSMIDVRLGVSSHQEVSWMRGSRKGSKPSRSIHLIVHSKLTEKNISWFDHCVLYDRNSHLFLNDFCSLTSSIRAGNSSDIHYSIKFTKFVDNLTSWHACIDPYLLFQNAWTITNKKAKQNGNFLWISPFHILLFEHWFISSIDQLKRKSIVLHTQFFRIKQSSTINNSHWFNLLTPYLLQ